MFGEPVFESRDKILQLGEALKFWVLFQKPLKLLKIIEKFQKMQNFHSKFSFYFAHNVGKIRFIIFYGYNEGFGIEPPEARKFFNEFIKNVNCKSEKVKKFSKI